MRKSILFILMITLSVMAFAVKKKKPVEVKDLFPDGTAIPAWFRSIEPNDISKLGKQYKLTEFGVVNDSNLIQTQQIQSVIDRAAAEGGGVIVIPNGTFLSGSLFFKP